MLSSEIMTVTLVSKHEITTSEDNEDETCGLKQRFDHTAEKLLKDLSSKICESKKNEIMEESETDDDIYREKARKLLCFHEAPEHLKHNEYILSGYRGLLNSKYCMQSVFWWTNETINIWSHLFGFLLFTALAIRDLAILDVDAATEDKIIVAVILVCFQACMILSSLYHTFNCRSERDCDMYLSFDLFGIALALLAIYASGIYFAFWCTTELRNFYLATITIFFVIAMALQIPHFKIDSNIKMLVFVSWAAYGVIPTLHWIISMGGFENPVVALLFPRVIGMYAISGLGFFIYLAKVPERFHAGKFDFLGHSHQWWHFLVVGALYYWHNSGMMYLDYRMHHACTSHMQLFWE